VNYSVFQNIINRNSRNGLWVSYTALKHLFLRDCLTPPALAAGTSCTYFGLKKQVRLWKQAAAAGSEVHGPSLQKNFLTRDSLSQGAVCHGMGPYRFGPGIGAWSASASTDI
jgi:hypothetical protein